MTTRIHPGRGKVAKGRLSGDHVLLVEKELLAGGNHLVLDPALGAARVRNMISHTQGRTKGQEVHHEIGYRDA